MPSPSEEVVNSLDLLGVLFRHMEWADAAVWRAVLATPATAGDGDIRERLLHLHTTQHAFLGTWVEAPFDREAGRAMDFPALVRWTRTFHAGAAAYLATLREEDLDRPHPVPWAARVAKAWGRDVAVTTLRETLLQAAAHSQYHRGQVNTRLKQLGGKPPGVDFIGWAWMGKPAVEWPEV
jgi:uncharacterized damage-inducible protein DinB